MGNDTTGKFFLKQLRTDNRFVQRLSFGRNEHFVLPCGAGFSQVQEQCRSETSCASSYLVLGPGLRECSFSSPSPHLLPPERQADDKARNRVRREEREGKRKGGGDRVRDGRTLQSVTFTGWC